MTVCPICNGKGTQFINDYDGMYDIVCDKCKGKGELDENGKPIFTNEEYIQTCNTEQLAELLLRFYYQDYCMNTKRRVIEWLKQPHSEVGK